MLLINVPVFEARYLYFNIRYCLLCKLQGARRRHQLLRCSYPSLLQVPDLRFPCGVCYPSSFCDEFIELMILCSAGIVPSNTTTYTLAQLQNAVKAQTGAIPFFGCGGTGAGGSAGRNILNEAWHFNHVLGTEQYGHFKPIDSTTPSTCSPTGIRYLERTPSSEREVRVIP